MRQTGTKEETMDRNAVVDAAEKLGMEDAAAGREPLWYRCGESYVSAETGHIGADDVGAAYLSGYAKVLAPDHGFNSERSQRTENGGRP